MKRLIYYVVLWGIMFGVLLLIDLNNVNIKRNLLWTAIFVIILSYITEKSRKKLNKK